MPRPPDELSVLARALERGWVTSGQVDPLLAEGKRAEEVVEELVRRGELDRARLGELSRTVVDPGATGAGATEADTEGARNTEGVRTVLESTGHTEPGGGTGRLARYETHGILGAGGMGEVVLATDPDLGRRVALKRLRPEAARAKGLLGRFVEEAQITAQLDHPNIVPVYELGRDSAGQPYYTMKEVRGRTLQEVVASGELTLPALLRIFVKVCDAVAFAHSRGVVHRDLKPANVMIGSFGEALVMDWGLARAGGAPHDAGGPQRYSGPASRTASGSVVGTPAYMSPEQAAGEPADERSDVYLLGGILFEILTGTPPHVSREGERRDAFLARIALGEVEPAGRRAPGRSVPREVEAIAGKALARSSADRYVSAADLRGDVEAYLDGRLVGAARYSALGAAAKWLRRHKPVAAAGVVLLASLAAFGVYRLLEWRAERARRAGEIAGAWAGVERLGPDRLQDEEIILLVLSHRVDPVDREPPTPTQRQDTMDSLDRLRALSEAYGEVLRLDPADARARERRYEVLLVLGKLAELAEDFAVAEWSFSEAASLGAGTPEANRLLSGVKRAREGQLLRHRREVLALLERAEAGELESAGAFGNARTDLVRYSARQTSEILSSRVREIAALLRSSVRDEILSAREPRKGEEWRGWKILDGLGMAVDAWLAAQPAIGQPAARPGPAELALVEEALARLERRDADARVDRERVRRWPALLASRETLALAEGGLHRERSLLLACQGLGILGVGGDAVESLAAYLSAEWDEGRAVHAGHAIARLGKDDPRVPVFLSSFAGPQKEGNPPGRWSTRGPYFGDIARGFRSPSSAASPSTAEELRLRADERLLANDLAGAIEDASRAIELAPDVAEGYTLRSVVRRAKDDLSGALADADRAVELDPASSWAHLVRGAARERQGDLAGALDDYTRSIGIDLWFAEAYYSRGRVRKVMGDLSGAVEDVTRAIDLDPGMPRAWQARGILRKESGDFAGAIEDFTRAIQLAPREAEAWNHRAHARHLAGDLARATSEYSKAIELDSRYFPAYHNRGSARLAAGDTDGALADAEAAIRLEPARTEGYLLRARVHEGRKESDGAMEDWERVLSIDPRNLKALGFRGSARLARGDLDGALADFERAIAVAPGDPGPFLGRGEARRRKGDLDGAIGDFSRAVELDPDRADARLSRGAALRAKGDLGAATADLDRALALEPGNVAALRERGAARRVMGDVDGAIEDLTAAIDRSPRPDSGLLVQRAAARRAAGELAGAIEDYERALATGGREATVLANRAETKRLLGDLAGAQADFTRAIEIDPKNAVARNNRGFAREFSGDLAGAMADYTRAAELDPKLGGPWKNQANLLARKGEWERAVEFWAKALELDPGARWAGEVRRSLEDGEDALLCLPRLEREPGTSEEFLALARARARAALLAADPAPGLALATEDFERASSHADSPAAIRTRIVLARSLLAAGRAAEALAIFHDLSERAPDGSLDPEIAYPAARAAGRLARENSTRELVDEAILWLERASRADLADPARPACEPDLAAVRADPRWPELQRSLVRRALGVRRE